MVKFVVKKRRVIFRFEPYNRLSFPVLLNVWETHGIDCRFEIVIRETPLTEKPVQSISKDDVILFSFMTPHLPRVHGEINTVKETGAWIVGGGPHISGEQGPAFEMGFDILFQGEGETNFLAFGSDLLDNKIEKKKIYKSTAGTTNVLDRYLPASEYIKELPPLELMRGCFWNCTYCSTGQNNAVFRSLESVRAYLDETARRQFKRVNYICPSSMEYGASRGRKPNLEKIEELLRLTAAYKFRFIEYGIFPSEIRPDTVTAEGMRMLKKYVSHKAVTLGAQSGSDERLKALKRAHTAADIEAATAAANDAGFLAYLDFIVAYPGETPGERRETLEFIQRLNKHYRIRTQLHHFFPLSGSAYAFRLPSFLTGEEKLRLNALKKNGISRDGWVKNEEQAIDYFDWLRKNFPVHYSMYKK